MYRAAERKFHRADLVLCPPSLVPYGTFDGNRHAEILEAGYAAAMERMGEIRRVVENGNRQASSAPVPVAGRSRPS